MLVAAWSILFVGLVFVMWSARGRRVNDYPICRACRYNLRGLSAASAKCPECGADLARRRAIRRGERLRRPIPLVASILVVLVAGSYVSMRGYSWSQTQNWNRMKPYWLLKHETVDSDFLRAEAARNELIRRYHEGDFDTARIANLVDHALAIQTNQPVYWSDTWGQFVETTWDNQHIGASRFHRYLRSALSGGLELAARPRVRHGSPFVVELTTGPFKSWGMSPYGVTFTPRDPRAGDLPLQFEPSDAAATPREAIAGTCPLTSGWNDPWTFVLPADVSPGEYVVELTVGYEIGRAETILTGEVALPVTVTVVPRDEPVIGLLTAREAPRLAKPVSEAIALDNYEMLARDHAGLPRRSFLAVRFDDPPVDIAYHAFARVGDREWELGGCVAERGRFNSLGSGAYSPEMAELFSHQSCDIVLRPAQDLAERTLDIKSIWGEEITYRDVPLEPALFAAWLDARQDDRDRRRPERGANASGDDRTRFERSMVDRS